MVLYPRLQAHSTDCWNWDGEFPAPLTTEGYDTRASVQIGIVNRAVDDDCCGGAPGWRPRAPDGGAVHHRARIISIVV